MNVPSARTTILALACLLSSATQAAERPGLLLSRSDAALTIYPNEIAVSRAATEGPPDDRGSATIRRAAYLALGVAAAAGLTAALLYFVVFSSAAKAAGNAAAHSGGPDNSNPLLNR